MTSRPIASKDVERELARARGSRRMLPWTVLSAAGAAAIGFAAGGGWRAAVALLALGLAFSAFVLATSLARCPGCGARLPSIAKKRAQGQPDEAARERAGGSGGREPKASGPPSWKDREPLRSCPHCLVRFE